MLESAGLLHRYELIEGEIILKVPKNLAHMRSVMFLMKWLVELFGIDFVMPEPSIDAAPEDNPSSEPEPDLLVLSRPFTTLISKPRAGDVRLLVEVSVTTLAFDSTIKAGLYARAGIADYWALDVNGRRMIVHRDPAQGRYRSIVAYGEDELVSPLANPDASMRVGDLL